MDSLRHLKIEIWKSLAFLMIINPRKGFDTALGILIRKMPKAAFLVVTLVML